MYNSFTNIATHYETDSDELTAVWQAMLFGGNLLPSEFSVEFFDAGTRTPDGKPVETWMAKRYLPIGIWGSPWDEHRNGSKPRKYGECAATLMAKSLGVSEDEKLKPILKYILECDYGKRAYQEDGLSVLVKKLHWQHPNDPFKVMDWFFKALDVKYGDWADPDNFSLNHIFSQMRSLGYEGAKEWYEVAKDAIKAQQKHFDTITPLEFAGGTVHEVHGTCGNVNVAVVESDEKLLVGYSRTKAGGQCGILIQKKSTGHIQIFSDKHRGVYLYNVAPIIRKLAMESCKRYSRNISHEYLSREGSEIFGAEEWCFMHGHLLLNGSNTTRNVKPTKLALDQVFEAVCSGLAIQKTKKHIKKAETMAV